jgi:hypothetical protein
MQVQILAGYAGVAYLHLEVKPVLVKWIEEMRLSLSLK